MSDPAVHKTMAVDLARSTHDDARLKDLERSLLQTAKHHAAHTLSLCPTVPGVGKILRRVLLDEMHQIDRFPSVQDFASSARLVHCRKGSGGKRWGTSGKNIGHAHLQGAFSEAAALCWRHHPQGQQQLRRLERQHDTGKALRILAPTLGRAIYCRLTRNTACDRDRCLRSYGSRAGEPGASRDSSGDDPACSTPAVRCGCVCDRPGVQRTRLPAPWRLMGHPLWLRQRRRLFASGSRGLPLPRT